MAITGFRIVITAGMGRFLRVIPQPNRSATKEEEARILAALQRLWPNSEAYWTMDETGVLGSGGKPISGRPSNRCCQLLYVSRNGRGEQITDEEAMRMIGNDLRTLFPGAEINYPAPS